MRRLLLLAFVATPALAQVDNYGVTQRGYVSRACGLDMNRNGIPGEASDCNVCDGVTTDPDGDGDAETMIYVDAALGTDELGCGAPGSPCATVGYAVGTIADGPTAGIEEIVCLKGTFTTENSWSPPDGAAGFITVAQSGRQARVFRVPSNPFMIVGWDADNDGEYPPHDTDDTCVIDGTSLGDVDLITSAGNDYFEFSHCVVQDYAGAGASFRSVSGGADADYHYFHDLRVLNWNKGRDLLTGTLMFSFFGSSGGDTNYMWVHNMEVLDQGGYFARGGCDLDGIDGGPFRFTNITQRAFPSSGAYPAGKTTGFKIWGYCSGLEVLDNSWDGNLSAYTHNTSVATIFINASQCSQDWTIRGNMTVDISHPILIQPHASGACDGAEAREVGPLVIEKNVFALEADSGTDQRPFSSAPSNPATGNVIGTVSLVDNIFYAAIAVNSFVWIRDDGADGQFTFTDNTFLTKASGSATAVLQVDDIPEALTWSRNVIDDGVAVYDRNVAHGAWWVSDFNAFSSFGGDFANLAAWQSATSDDPNSEVCTPTYVDALNDDYRIDASDTCALPLGAGADPGASSPGTSPGLRITGVTSAQGVAW